jgi:hypothetical protein
MPRVSLRAYGTLKSCLNDSLATNGNRRAQAGVPVPPKPLPLRLWCFGRSWSRSRWCCSWCGRCCWRLGCGGRRMRRGGRSRGVRTWGAVAACAGLRVSASRTRSLRTCCASSERKQRDVARALDRFAEPALMTSANAGHAARKNFSTLLHELRQDVGALVVDEIHLLDTELADFLFAEILALAAARTAGTTARTAFATWATVSTGATMSAAGAVSTGTRTARG